MRSHVIAAAVGCLVGLATAALLGADLPGLLLAAAFLFVVATVGGGGYYLGALVTRKRCDETLDIALPIRGTQPQPLVRFTGPVSEEELQRFRQAFLDAQRGEQP